MKTQTIVGNLKLFLNLVGVLAFSTLTFVAGAAPVFDNFESYSVGSDLHGQGDWTGWRGDTNAGALVSTNQAFSPTRSVNITGDSDLVHTFSGATNGQWVFNTMQYIPSGSTGTTYVVLLNRYQSPYGTGDLNWSVQIQNNMDTGEVISDHLGSGTLPMIKDQWVEVRCEIDLGSNTVSEFYNGELLSTHQWQDGTGDNAIAALDLVANNAGPVYYDDVSLAVPVAELHVINIRQVGSDCCWEFYLIQRHGGPNNITYVEATVTTQGATVTSASGPVPGPGTQPPVLLGAASSRWYMPAPNGLWSPSSSPQTVTACFANVPASGATIVFKAYDALGNTFHTLTASVAVGTNGECSPPCVTPPPGMVAWWPLDEPIGSPAVNELVAGMNGNVVPGPLGSSLAPAAVPGNVSGAMYAFDPSGYVEVPSLTPLDLAGSDFTIDAWINPVLCGTNSLYPIVDKLDVGNSGGGYALYITGGQLTLSLGDPSAGGQTFTCPIPLNLSTWNFVSVVVDYAKPVVTFYVNGLAQAVVGPAPFPVGPSPANLWIGGSRLSSSAPIVCEIGIDELEFFQRALDTNELDLIFHAGSSGKCKPSCGVQCPPDKTVECGTSWAFDPPTALTNFCTNVTIQLISSNLIASPCPDVWQGVWEAIDCYSNSVMCTQTVTVVDTTPPVISCASNKTVECCRPTTITVTLCGVVDSVNNPLTQLPPPWDAVIAGETWCLTYTFDPTAPGTITQPVAGSSIGFYNTAVSMFSTTFSTTFGPASTTQTVGPAGASLRAFSNYPTPVDQYAGDFFWLEGGSRLRVGFNFHDSTGNAWNTAALPSCVNLSDFTTADFTMSYASGPGGGEIHGMITNVLCVTNPCTPWQFDPPAAFDACSGTNVTIRLLSTQTNGVCPQVFTRVWEATDACSNSVTCTQTVTEVDTTPPTIVCPTNIVVESCTNVAVCYTVTATDTCTTNVTVTCDPPSCSQFAPGTVTMVHCVATDECGNSSSCDFTVTVVERQPLALFNTGVNANGTLLPAGGQDPHYSLPVNPNGGGASAFVVSPIDAAWLTNNSMSQWIGPTTDGIGLGGVYTYRMTFQVDCTNDVLISGRWAVDDAGSIILNGATTVSTVSGGSGFGSWHPFTITSGLVPGLNTLEFFVTNAIIVTGLRVEVSGSTDCCTNCAVTIDCPTNIVVSCSEPGGTPVFYSVSATSSCSSNVTVTCEPPSGSMFAPCMTTLVRCMATDEFGNTANCEFTVTVEDTVAPVITCASNKTVECGSPWTFDPPTAFDACCGTNVTVSVLSDVMTGSCPQVFTRTWEATDCCGNTAICSQRITVGDTIPPIISCPSNMVVQATDTLGAFVNYAVTATDDCQTNVIVVCTPPSGSFFPCGTNLVSCTATDACGNSTNCSFQVVVHCPCLGVVNEQLTCPSNAPGQFSYSFDLQNNTGVPVKYLFLVPDTNCFRFTPDILTFKPPIPPGQTTNVSVTIDLVGSCTTNLCFTLAAHDSNLVQCCAIKRCIDPTAGPRLLSAVPSCGTNKITITFDKPLDPATFLGAPNFVVDDLTHAVSVPLASATFGPDLKTVCLITTAPLGLGTQYQLTVNNVRDTCGNLIAPNSRVTFCCSDPGHRLIWTFANGQLCLSWLCDGVLECTTSLSPPVVWAPAPNQSNPQCIVPGSGQKFFRLRP